MEGGARATALGGAATALRGDAWGHSNPATWATLDGRTTSFFISEAFGLNELRLAALHAVQPTRWGTVALGARTFGFEDFRETFFGVGYARSLALGTTRRFHAALNLRYHRVSIPRYGSAGAVGVSVGGLVEVAPRVDLGFHASNINLPQLAGREDLPRTLAVGLGYRPDDRLRVLLDVFKDIDFPLSLRGGVEVVPVPVLALRGGFTTAPNRFTAGVGVRVQRLTADFAAEHHEVLGWSPGVSLSVVW